MNSWKALLLIYCKVDLRYPVGWCRRKRFTHQLPAAEVDEAEDSFRQFPMLVEELTDGRASVDYAIVHVGEPLRSVSEISHGGFWPSPADTCGELAQYAPPGRFDSIFIFWPQSNLATGRAVPSA